MARSPDHREATSGIGRAVAITFAKEGVDVAIETQRLVEEHNAAEQNRRSASKKSLARGEEDPRQRRRPGPIWTPLIPSTFDEEKVET